MGIDFVKLSLDEFDNSTSYLNEGQLYLFVKLLCHSESAIALSVANILAATKSHEHNIIGILKKLEVETTGVEHVRIVELLTKIQSNMVSKWDPVLALLKDGQDQLALMNALQIVIDNCSSPVDVRTLNENGALDIIHSLVRDSSQESFVRSLAICAFSAITLQTKDDSSSGSLLQRYDILSWIKDLWDAEIDLNSLAIMVCYSCFICN